MIAPVKEKLKKPRCGLCGKTKNLEKTSCCGNWICNDHHKYVLFSYARNSCARNHSRYTLCAFHHNEQHEGDWKTCKICRESFTAEMVVWYGTNEYNFEKMPDPPKFEPTTCISCGTVIALGVDAYTIGPDGFQCERCYTKKCQQKYKERQQKQKTKSAKSTPRKEKKKKGKAAP